MASIPEILKASYSGFKHEIAELRSSLERSRVEANQLRVVTDTQRDDLAFKDLLIKKLEENERLLSEDVRGLLRDMAAAEEEIARWRDAAEQEAAAGIAVMRELTIAWKRLRKMKRHLDEINKQFKCKEEVAAAAVAARDAAERSLPCAKERASILTARTEELTRRLEKLQGRNERRNLGRKQYSCWPNWQWVWQWLRFVRSSHP